jgi:uncharacterized protein YaaW (UPF0174 family)
MRPFHNTPSLRTHPIIKKELTGKELLYSLEDKLANYIHDCNEGYCKLDLDEMKKLKDDITKAKQSLE